MHYAVNVVLFFLTCLDRNFEITINGSSIIDQLLALDFEELILYSRLATSVGSWGLSYLNVSDLLAQGEFE